MGKTEYPIDDFITTTDKTESENYLSGKPIKKEKVDDGDNHKTLDRDILMGKVFIGLIIAGLMIPTIILGCMWWNIFMNVFMTEMKRSDNIPIVHIEDNLQPSEAPDNHLNYMTCTGNDYYRWYDSIGLTPMLSTYDTDREAFVERHYILGKFVEEQLMMNAASGPFRINYMPDADELDLFIRVVEAEVTGTFSEDDLFDYGMSEQDAYMCKKHVADVIINRVNDSRFPDTITEVIMQKNAFSPVADGRANTVTINSITVSACRDALLQPDSTNGALFFNVGTKNAYATYAFSDSIGHSFFVLE